MTSSPRHAAPVLDELMAQAISRLQASSAMFSFTARLEAGVSLPSMTQLRPYAHRLLKLDIKASSACFSDIFALPPGSFPGLEVCFLRLKEPIKEPVITHSSPCALFRDIESLRSFHLLASPTGTPHPTIVDPAWLALSWSNLEHLDLTGVWLSMPGLHATLSQCPQLGQLNARCSAEDGSVVGPGLVSLSYLQSLTLHCPPADVELFFRPLMLPTLEDLEIVCDERVQVGRFRLAEWLTGTCLSSLSQPVSALRRLAISCGAFSTDALYSLLRSAANIEILIFRVAKFDRGVLKRLEYGDSEPAPLLSKLGTLVFTDCSIQATPAESLDPFLCVVESRVWTDEEYAAAYPRIRCLEVAHLCGEESGDFTPDMWRRIQDCRYKGLVLQTFYNPDELDESIMLGHNREVFYEDEDMDDVSGEGNMDDSDEGNVIFVELYRDGAE